MIYKPIRNYLSKGSDRSVAAKKNIAAMFIIKGITILINFAYVPLLIDTLNAEVYGVWLTLVAIIGWLSYFDVGLGHGLRNRFGESIAQNDRKKARSYVSTAYLIMFGIALFLMMIQITIFPLINWATVLNAPQDLNDDLKILVLFVGALACLQLVIKLITSILLALQKPALSAFVITMSQLVTFILVFILIKLRVTKTILDLGILISLIPIVVLSLFSLFFFTTGYKQYRPSFKYYDHSLIKPLLNLGIAFFFVQFISLVLFQANNLIIAHVCGNSCVTEYNVAYKYIGVINMVFYLIVTPFWSATTEAYNKKDFIWIKNSISSLNKVWLLLVFVGAIAVAFAEPAYKIWIGDSLTVSYPVLLLFLLYFAIYMRWSLFGSFINGIGKIRIQMYVLTIEALIHIPLAILLGTKLGIKGVIISMIITSVLNVYWPPIQISKLISGTATNIWNK